MRARLTAAARPRFFTLAVTAALLLPVSFSGSDGPASNELCASGNCCWELNSLCTANGRTMVDYYSSFSGDCKIIIESAEPGD